MKAIGKSICSMLLCACAIFAATAQVKPLPEVIFNAHWLKNEYQRYDLRYQTYTLQQNDTLQSARLSCQADVMVTDSSYRSFRMEWRFYDFQYIGKSYLNTRWMKQLGECKLICQTSPVGVLQEIQQPDDLRSALDKSIDQLYKNYESLPSLEAREALYALREEVEEWLFSAVYHFYKTYGLAYQLGQVVAVPDQMGFEDQAFAVTRYKKLENYHDDVATLVVATLPDSAIYTPEHQPLQMENSSAMMMHIPSGWPVYTYDHLEYGLASHKQGILNEITLKQE